jgi:hypothetical protein
LAVWVRIIRSGSTKLPLGHASRRSWQSGGDLATGSTLATSPLGVATLRIADEAAEVSVIASLLASPWQFDQVTEWLRPEDFTRRDAHGLYVAIAEVVAAGQPIDVVDVVSAGLRHAGADERLDHQGSRPACRGWCPRLRGCVRSRGSASEPSQSG